MFWDCFTVVKIVSMGRTQGFLAYKEYKIQVFPDLPVETIQHRHSLKPVTTKLNDVNICYEWISSNKLRVNYNAWDEDAGLDLLQKLNLDEHSDGMKRTH